jgi:putative SOS response-associated peptidase YedK
MCGRFTQRYTWAEVRLSRRVRAASQPDAALQHRAPVDVIRPGPNGSELAPMRWDLIPGWWKKSAKEVPATSTRARNPSSINRCSAPPPRSGAASSPQVVSSNGPAPGPTGNRISSRRPTAPILVFAGLCERWRDPASGDEVLSCTIIVYGASAWMRQYHDRMPMILAPGDFET